MSDGYSVYTGIWTNWRDGSRVLTVTQRDGAILIATMALVTSVSMGQLWSILRFAAHQFRSTEPPRGGLHHQQQAVLRSDAASASVLASLIKIAWAWKSKHIGAIRQSSPLIALAALHLALLAASAIFSSRVAIAGDEVLLRAGLCGWADGSASSEMNSTERADSQTAAWSVGRELATRSQRYARSCYNTTGKSQAEPGACKSYAAAQLPFTARSVPCPFSKDICALPDAAQIDTGYIDSINDLGINTSPELRVRFRRLFTCAPLLAEERFSSNWTQAPLARLPGDTYRYYFLGPAAPSPNFTLAVSNYTYWNERPPNAYNLLSVGAVSGYFDDGNVSAYSPIPDLRVDNADITLLLLGNMAWYRAPVEDAWFRATSPVHQTGARPAGAATDAVWYPDHAVSVLGCTDQYEFCNTTHCSPPDGRPLDGLAGRADEIADKWFPNTQQKAMYYVLVKALWLTYLPRAVLMYGGSILLAQDSLVAGSVGVSGGLPADQWRAEVGNLAAAALAALQRFVVDFAAPPAVPVSTVLNGTLPATAFVRAVDDDRGGSLCGSVRVRDARFTNFSVAGVATVLALGATVTLVNALCVPGAVFALRRRLRLGGRFAEREWREAGLLRLQRTAFETHGVRPWEADGDGDVPTTMDERLVFSAESMWAGGGKTRGPSYGFLASHQDEGKPGAGDANDVEPAASPVSNHRSGAKFLIL